MATLSVSLNQPCDVMYDDGQVYNQLSECQAGITSNAKVRTVKIPTISLPGGAIVDSGTISLTIANCTNCLDIHVRRVINTYYNEGHISQTKADTVGDHNWSDYFGVSSADFYNTTDLATVVTGSTGVKTASLDLTQLNNLIASNHGLVYIGDVSSGDNYSMWTTGSMSITYHVPSLLNPTGTALLTTEVASFKTSVVPVFTTILPLAIALFITIQLFYYGWKLFLEFFHKKNRDYE